jgi:hypothetical protein
MEKSPTPIICHIILNLFIMARIRNTHCLIGSRNFSIPTQEQRFMFFYPEEVKNGTMDTWMKSVQINWWERHDNEDCTVFHLFSMLGNSNFIRRILDDATWRPRWLDFEREIVLNRARNLFFLAMVVMARTHIFCKIKRDSNFFQLF